MQVVEIGGGGLEGGVEILNYGCYDDVIASYQKILLPENFIFAHCVAEASLARKQRLTASGDAEKAAANQSAFNAWLAGKGTKNSTEKFHVKCIDGQLFAVWR